MQPPQPPGPSLASHRADAGTVKLTGRDITGLMLCAEHYAAPYDQLAAALNVRGDRLRGIVARWRHTGYADTGTLGPGPPSSRKAGAYPRRPGAAAGAVTKQMSPAGSSGSVTGGTRPGRRTGLGWKAAGHLAVIPGQAEQTRPRPSRSFVQWGAPPGQARPGPLPLRAGRRRGDSQPGQEMRSRALKRHAGTGKGKAVNEQ
jgi:hypothetical protein